MSDDRSQRQKPALLLRAGNEAERLGVAYRRIRVGNQRTLWGSCSPSGSLSFNWRLVLAPLEVFDYVVVHELCHLLVPNHSQAFWKLVERQRPGWRASRQWLGEYGSELLAFRATEPSVGSREAIDAGLQEKA